MSYRQLDIKHSYVSYGDENIAKAFLVPMLRKTKLYRRSVGFFSSSVFSTIIDGIVTLSRNGGQIQLIASPNLSAEDIHAINVGYQKREDIIAGAFERDFADAIAELEDAQLQLLAALIANDTLDIKIAVTKGTGIYHDKLGILEDFDGNIVVFYGSANSTASGYKNNYEKIRVVKSWVQTDAESIADEVEEFDALWNNTNPHVTVYDYTASAQAQILKVVERRKTDPTGNKAPIKLRDYQQDAINAWVANNHHGFYVMATGTGKTWTAIYSAVELLKEHSAMVVICAPYKHLVRQWAEDVEKALPDAEIVMVSSENHNWDQQLTQAIVRQRLYKDTQIVVISTITSFNLARFKKVLNKSKQEKMLIVDEAHRFTNRPEELKDQFQYMLGLSATPFSGKNTAKGMELMEFFGGQVFSLPIENALERGFLVPYYYYPIFVDATDDEEERFNKKSAQIASCFNKKGVCIDPENLALHLRARLRIISMADEKLKRIAELLGHVKEKDHFIVYCGDGRLHDDNDEEIRHIEFVKETLSSLGFKSSQFTASENMMQRMELVEAFNEGAIDALAAIRCLDEGINIPSITGALILSSNDDYREFVQRRGRILRTYKDKKFENFRNFKDKCCITFPTDGSVTVIYGPNGVGKTTLHQLFQWIFCGEVHFNKTASKEMFNLDFEQEAAVNKAFSVWGIIDFEHPNSAGVIEKYSIRREWVYRKELKETKVVDRKIRISKDTGAAGKSNWVTLTTDTEKAAKLIEQILPSGLSQYFFFDGESMIADLGKTGKDSAKALRKALFSIFDLDIYEQATVHLGSQDSGSSTVLGKLYLSLTQNSSNMDIIFQTGEFRAASKRVEKLREEIESYKSYIKFLICKQKFTTSMKR